MDRSIKVAIDASRESGAWALGQAAWPAHSLVSDSNSMKEGEGIQPLLVTVWVKEALALAGPER